MAGAPTTPDEVLVDEAHCRRSEALPLVDIRTASERAVGVPQGSVALDGESILARCRAGEEGAPEAAFLICDSGVRSLKLVNELKELGCSGFSSVAGGFQAWRAAGLPLTTPPGITPGQAERYARHLVMPQVGPEGQRKLLAARILLVGLGGLNSPAALYLAAAGVGRLGLLDFDQVERSNLQRQVLHGEPMVGSSKASSAQSRLAELNPETETVLIETKVDPGNALDVVSDWDLVIDGSDNFETRYALNDACMQLSLPLVYGAVMRFQGQVSVFRGQPCFRCLMPAAPEPGETPSCAEAGVLGVLPGIVGTLQAAEALKLLLGIGNSLAGHLLMFDALDMEFRKMRIGPRDDCPVCGKSSCNNRE